MKIYASNAVVDVTKKIVTFSNLYKWTFEDKWDLKHLLIRNGFTKQYAHKVCNHASNALEEVAY